MTLDTGSLGAKRSNHDNLLEIMRAIVRQNPDLSQSETVELWLAQIIDEGYLRDAAEYAGNNIYRRCRPVIVPSRVSKKEVELTAKAREHMESRIKLWAWTVPTVGKTLPDCTFGEIASAAPRTGRFLSRLSQEGAPGTLIREVFKSEEELQVFWKANT